MSPVMWREPYLESCCRSALHRLILSGRWGRPAELPDGACLSRLAEIGLSAARPDGRYTATASGIARYRSEICRETGLGG